MQIYSIYHLNTSFSSIEKKQIPVVINKCYWPLLELAILNDIKISIEASASTLLDIYKVDKNLINRLKYLIRLRKCEFIGSGYKQIIGPLVPFEINNYNIKRGDQIYREMLDYKPNIFYVCEQAISKSMLDLYHPNGYDSIVIDWNNYLKANPSTKNDLQFKICNIKDNNKNRINIIWNNSVNFQQFQRYIYDERTFGEFTSKILKLNKKNINWSFYGSDAEIFNYRPKRFFNENEIQVDEWSKIKNLYLDLSKKKGLKFNFINNIIKKNKSLIKKLTSAEHPILVKKQNKYNITRWALTGKDNLALNRHCWSFFEKIKNNKNNKKWDILCDLWSSDYRTHITEKKWSFLKKKLKKKIKEKKINLKKYKIKKNNLKNYLIKNKNIEVLLDQKKGYSIKSYINKNISFKSLFGWLQQGEIDFIDHDVDYFSGHFVQVNGKNKNTCLNLKSKFFFEGKKKLLIKGTSNKIRFIKKIELKNNELHLGIEIKKAPPGIVRLFFITLNSKNFNKNTLFYACKNGSNKIEKFSLKNSKSFNHGSRVSDIVSATTCLGATDGIFYIGDGKKMLKIYIDRKTNPILPMVEFFENKKNYLLRVYFSSREMDDTSKHKIDDIAAKIKIKTLANTLF
jgi:hypothetical protein